MKINLKKIREESGLTQLEVAEKLGVTQQQYSRYETGINKVTLETFLKIAELCHLEIKIEKKTKNN